VAETNGLLNRRTGKSGTEGSNPSVSASNSANRRLGLHSALVETAVLNLGRSVGLIQNLPFCRVAYFPRQTGFLFSAKALGPSCASSLL
jgi:hypothetical protein